MRFFVDVSEKVPAPKAKKRLGGKSGPPPPPSPPHLPHPLVQLSPRSNSPSPRDSSRLSLKTRPRPPPSPFLPLFLPLSIISLSLMLRLRCSQPVFVTLLLVLVSPNLCMSNFMVARSTIATVLSLSPPSEAVSLTF